MKLASLTLALCALACGSSGSGGGAHPVAWEVQLDAQAQGEALSPALLGYYDLSGEMLGYAQAPGLKPALAAAGFAGADWRIGLGRWETATWILPALSTGAPCAHAPFQAAPAGASDLDLIAARDWFADTGAPVSLADTQDDTRYRLAYVRAAADVALAFGARPFLSVDSMPRALSVNRSPQRSDCQSTFRNAVSNARPENAGVFAAAVAGMLRRLVVGTPGEPGRPITHVEFWNEPELPFFWDPSFEDRPGPLDRFFEMTITTLVELDAMRNAASDPELRALRFGLASFADPANAVRVISAFDAAPEPPPADFFSFHAYADDPLRVVSAIESVAAARRASRNYAGAELALAEWGPDLARNGDAAYAASIEPALHAATVIALGSAAGLDRAHHALLWDFFPPITLGPVSHSGQAKPLLRAYELLARLIVAGAVRLPPTSHSDGRLSPDGSLLVSRLPAGELRALYVNRGNTSQLARVRVGSQPRTPRAILVFSDPSAAPRAVTASPIFEVPARSLVFVEL